MREKVGGYFFIKSLVCAVQAFGAHNFPLMMASMPRALLGLLLGALLLAVARTDAYRIFGSDDVDKPFRPYERGFVGEMIDPNIPAQPTGYFGTSYADCALTHHQVGGQCLPKKTCPNSCSSNGECDTFTGRCRCNEFREGDDCSALSCEKFHPECTRCNDDGCTSCRCPPNINKSNSFTGILLLINLQRIAFCTKDCL